MNGEEKVFFRAEEAEPYILAVTQDYLKTTGKKILKGRFLNSSDFIKYRPVIVIDKFLADTLFKNENPIEQQLFTGGRLYLVVGVIETKMNFGNEPKGNILLPISIYSAMTGRESIQSIFIRPRHPKKMDDDNNSFEQNLQLSIRQPLLRGAGITVNKASIQLARINEENNIINLKSILSDTITTSIFAYRELLQAQERVEIEQLSLKNAQESLEVTKALIAAGRIAPVEIGNIKYKPLKLT